MAAKLLDFYSSEHSEDKVIVYGTGLWGGLVTKCLKQKGLTPYGYATTLGGSEYHGKRIYSLTELEAFYSRECAETGREPVIIMAVHHDYEEEIYKAISATSIEHVYNHEMLLNDVDAAKLEMTDDEARIFCVREWYGRKLREIYGQLMFNILEVEITEKCSLRCERCANLMQYYRNPQDIDVDEIMRQLETLLEYTDMIYELHIIGGEPFMRKGFEKLAEMCAGHRKIKKTYILSNATIMPDKHMLDVIRKNHVIMRFSDYGELSGRLAEWLEWCRENDVCYEIMRAENWFDLGELRKRNRTAEENRRVYEKCENDCFTLLKGRLSVCEYAANSSNLGAMTAQEIAQDTLNVADIDSQETLRKFLFEREYLAACDYCGGRCSMMTKPHVQVKEPLAYERKVNVH
jgi:hypothetical protein